MIQQLLAVSFILTISLLASVTVADPSAAPLTTTTTSASAALQNHEQMCPESLTCTDGFGGHGFQIKKTGLFGKCHSTCSKPLVAKIKLLLGLGTCGNCGMDYKIDLPPEVINRTDVEYLASDELNGRDNDSPGSFAAQEYLIDQLELISAIGLNTAQSTGRDAFKQVFGPDMTVGGNLGTNILGMLKGSELPDEYVFLSAHYDHIRFCSFASGADSFVCNGATDNAASVAIVLGIGRAIADLPSRPRRSIVFAFWDSHEDGHNGSRFFTENPLVPLHTITAFLNWDIAGLNILPSLKNNSFALGAETGGHELKVALSNAIADEGLEVQAISQIFGLGRSDHTIFVVQSVPSLFFTDVTSGCYHTRGDEVKVVDFSKLEKEAKIGLKLTFELTMKPTPPHHHFAPVLTFHDASILGRSLDLVVSQDLDLFGETDQVQLLDLQSQFNGIVAQGPLLFQFAKPDLALATQELVSTLGNTVCDGYLA